MRSPANEVNEGSKMSVLQSDGSKVSVLESDENDAVSCWVCGSVRERVSVTCNFRVWMWQAVVVPRVPDVAVG